MPREGARADTREEPLTPVSDAHADAWAEDNDEQSQLPCAPALCADLSDLLTPPRVAARLVPRTRQFRRLDRLTGLTIIEALPGFGKTTLVVDWARGLESTSCRVVWVRATAEVDDETRFRELLHEGLVRVGALPESAPRPGVTRAEQQSWLDGVASIEPMVLVVIDDAHLLRDHAVAESLVRLVERARSVHLVVLADTDHPFTDAAARHGLETNVLRAGDLGIPADSVQAFGEAWGHDLSAESAAKLHSMVGGWLLPLRLVLDATPSWAQEFATHATHEFLTARVLPIITDTAELSMAMRFAVPAELDIELAAALVDDGSPDTDNLAATLADLATSALERHGLLWRLARHDGEPRWTYPALLRRALLQRLERTQPDAARANHRVVARVLAARRGDTELGPLLRHARSGDDWSLLAELWSVHGWSFAGGEAAEFEFAYGAIPAPVLQEHPPLRLAAALADALSTCDEDLDMMRRVEALLHRYMETGSDLLRHGQPARSPSHAVELLTAGMVARRSEGNLAEARRLAADAAREVGRARVSEPDRVRSSQVGWFHLQNAITQYLSANYTAAFEQARTAHQVGPGTLVGAGASGFLAAMNTAAGNTAEGRHWLASHESVDLSGSWAAGLAELPARLTRAMLALDRLDEAAAETELAEVQLGPESSGIWPLVVVAHHRYALIFGDSVAMLSRLEHLRRVLARHFRDDGGLAGQVLDRCTVDLWLALAEVNRVQARMSEGAVLPPWLLAPAARLHRMTDNPHKAIRIASAAVWRDDIAVRDRTELLVTSSLAHHEVGATDRSLEAFRRAHALSTDTGNLQPLLLVPSELRAELLAGTGLELPPEAVARLDAVGPLYPERADLIRLSPREREVLRQIAHHETAADLAKTLTVSVNTVKKQLASLYVKLDVSDRASALLRAQALGLLGDVPGVDKHES